MTYTSQRAFAGESKRARHAELAKDYRGDVRSRPRPKDGPAKQFSKEPAGLPLTRVRDPLPVGKSKPGEADYNAPARPERMTPVKNHGPGVQGPRVTRP